MLKRMLPLFMAAMLVVGLFPSSAIAQAALVSAAETQGGEVAPNFKGRLSIRANQMLIQDSIARVEKVVTDGSSCAAITSGGSLWVWGKASGADDLYEPVRVLDGVSDVSLGGGTFGAVKEDGSLWMWGSNAQGQFGNGTRLDAEKPVKVMQGVKSVSCSSLATMILMDDGSAWEAGVRVGVADWTGAWNDENLLAIEPVKIYDNQVTEVYAFSPSYSSAGSAYACFGVLDKQGALFLWSLNDESPKKVLEGVRVASMGGSYLGPYYAAIRNDNTLWMWGDNWFGQIAQTENEGYDEPMQVDSDVIAAEVGGDYTVAVKSDGTLWIWGGAAEPAGAVNDLAAGKHKIANEVSDASIGGAWRDYYGAAITREGGLLAWGHVRDGDSAGYVLTGNEEPTPLELAGDSFQTSSLEDAKGTSNSPDKDDTVSADSSIAPVVGASSSPGVLRVSEGMMKAANPMKVKLAKKTFTVKAKKLKRKAQSVKPLKVTGAAGKVTFKNVSTKKALKKFKVAAKTGKVTVPKKTKKGTYKVKVRVSAAGDVTHLPASKTVTVKIKVK